MSTFVDNNTIAFSKPDPSKHVNYVEGMILGVDDFTQEFTYLSGRDQSMARDIFGYGTVCGLKVSVDQDEERNGIKGPWVHVCAGAAVNPQGQMIRVKNEQCANLRVWLEKNKDEIAEHIKGSPPADFLKLYVVLCYRECPTDNEPIPGEPCRSEEDLMAPSRWQDDFKLEFRPDAPEQSEDDALRDFIDWLRRSIEVTDEHGSPPNGVSIKEFEAALRGAVCSVTSPPSSPPDFMSESPPHHFAIYASNLCEYLRAAFRIWVTELRPRWRAKVVDQAQICNESSEGQKAQEADSVLLAELDVALTADRRAIGGTVTVNEEKRPYLVHLRMLQELLMCGKMAQSIVQEISSGVTEHSALTGLENDDHKLYLPVDPNTRALKNNLNANGHKMIGLAQAAANGEAVRYEQAVKSGDPAGGDLSGTFPNPKVDRSLFVQAAAGLCAIVAAGYFKADGTPVNASYVYNGLKVKQEVDAEGQPTGYYWLNFKGYENPKGSHMYILKGMVGSSKYPAVFQFDKFGNNDEGIRIRIRDNMDRFAYSEFLVEISAFEKVK